MVDRINPMAKGKTSQKYHLACLQAKKRATKVAAACREGKAARLVEGMTSIDFLTSSKKAKPCRVLEKYSANTILGGAAGNKT